MKTPNQSPSLDPVTARREKRPHPRSWREADRSCAESSGGKAPWPDRLQRSRKNYPLASSLFPRSRLDSKHPPDYKSQAQPDSRPSVESRGGNESPTLAQSVPPLRR